MGLCESSFVNGLLTLLKTARVYTSYFYDLRYSFKDRRIVSAPVKGLNTLYLLRQSN